MIKREHLIFKDSERPNLKDKMVGGSPTEHTGIKGRVQIHTRDIEGTDKKLYLVEDTGNLIVYRGRNWLMQRAFEQDMSGRAGWKDKWINWFGIGTGGAVSGQPLVPASPDLGDCALGSHGLIGSGTRWTQCDDLGAVARDYHMFDDGYPIFINDPDVDNGDLCTNCTSVDPLDSTTYNCEKFLITLIRTTLTADEASDTLGLGYQDINEAGLFVSPSEATGYAFAAEDMEIFARVCFSTIRKDVNRELIFSWYIYF